MFVSQLKLGPWDNFITFVGCSEAREVAVVDPAWDAAAILGEAARLGVRITDVLLTHSHFDHVNRVNEVLDATDAQVHMLGAEIDFSGFRSENLTRRSAGDRVRVGRSVEITVMHTPGHTPGSTSYLAQGALVTGDTLFVNGCGRCDFVGGDPVVMYSTLRALCEGLPGDTVMYPGHDYGDAPTARLDAQLLTNPYLVLPTLDDYVRHRMTGKTPGTSLPPPPAWPPAT